MINIITFMAAALLFGCTAHKKAVDETELPVCLKAKIDSMTANPNEGAPQSISRYNYKEQTVYYLKVACCDKYNIVFDGGCRILGYPDGGFTGKGDGKMPDFFKDAKDGKILWSRKPQK